MIIDEVHSYRGIFGVHMTGIVRRLLLTARRLGARPALHPLLGHGQQPLDLAARLTSLPQSDFDLLDADQDGSQQADKHWLVLNPDWGSRSAQVWQLPGSGGGRVCGDAASARDAAGQDSPAQHHPLLPLDPRGEDRSDGWSTSAWTQRAPHLKHKVKSYVSAELTVEAKREIYEGLRSGRCWG